jgi:hypothetical protein
MRILPGGFDRPCEEDHMAATTSNATPRKNGFDFAALSASAGNKDSSDEVARLREALETLAELVVAHGVMDAKTLESIVGDLIATPMMPVALSAPLPPPALSAAEALLKGPIPKPAAVKAAPAAKTIMAPAPVAAKPVAAPAPVAAKPVAAPAPVAAKPVVAPTPAPIVAPAPVAVAPAPVAVAPAPVAAADPVVPPSSVQPVVASPFPSEPKPVAAPARKNPFDAKDAARLEAELTETPPPALKPSGFFARLLGKGKTSPAAVAKAAASVEFTERMAKLPFEGLYSEQQRATELSFPPAATVQKRPRAAAPAKKKAARPVDAAPARFCDRCWRRMDASGTCKTCSPYVSA